VYSPTIKATEAYIIKSKQKPEVSRVSLAWLSVPPSWAPSPTATVAVAVVAGIDEVETAGRRRSRLADALAVAAAERVRRPAFAVS